MISKYEFLYTKSKIEKIKKILGKLDFGVYDKTDPAYEFYQLYKKWEEFEKLPYADKKILWDKWNKYYAECRQSDQAKRFFAIKEAANKGDIAKVKDLANEAKLDLEFKLLKEIPKPSEYDPSFLSKGTQWVVDMRQELVMLVMQYDEYKNVYEKRDKQEDYEDVERINGIF